MKNSSSFYSLILPLFLALFLVSFLFFSACNTKTTYETVKIDYKYSLDLPSFLSKTNDLNDDASLQFKNMWKEFYVVVIEDSKADFSEMLNDEDTIKMDSNKFESFITLFTTTYTENLNLELNNNMTDWKIGMFPAKNFSMTGTLEGSEIYYHFTVVEGKDTYYQIIQWTLADRKDNYKAEMDKIAKSFKEL